ncbi:MAG TPA: hypothetical protein VME23_16490 [Terracidiphilus sp.]|nr:hypothetical protein [Terracidiphilus sp.]
MASDCPMMGMTAAQGCMQNCCSRNVIEAVLSRASSNKAKAASSAPLAVPTSTTVAADPARLVVVLRCVRADSPPRYIVNRVFRI